MNNLVLVISLLVAQQLGAQVLTARAIYERCYAKLVRETPKDNDPFLGQLAPTGSLSGPAACRQLARLAILDSSGALNTYPGEAAKRDIAQKILTTMNELHHSWYTVKKFSAVSVCQEDANSSAFDYLEPAYYFTRALFSPSHKIDSVVTSSDQLRARRSVNNPSASIFDPDLVQIEGFPTGFRLVGNGKLLGFTAGPNPTVATMTAVAKSPEEDRASQPFPQQTNVKAIENKGGGVLGSQSYIYGALQDNGDLFPDLEKMPRSWAKYVFEDMLCRKLPVITEADAKPFAVCNNTARCGIQPTAAQAPHVLPFRGSTSCVQCHASMDQMAGVLRNHRLYKSASRCSGANNIFSVRTWLPDAPTKPLSRAWGFVADETYNDRPAFGRLLFRTHDNKKINIPFNNFTELGQAIADTEDFYICAAKRYYQHFTGIEVGIEPLTASQFSALPEDQKFFRGQVVELGRKLKSETDFNKNPIRVLDTIFSSPEFRNRDFRLREIATSGGQ